MSLLNSSQRLKQIWNQSQNDISAMSMDGRGYQARLYRCVRIVNDNSTGVIAIYNYKGLFSKEITQEQYSKFLELGWSEGVKTIQVYNLNKEAARLKVLIQGQTYTKALVNKLKKIKDELQQIIGGQH